ISLEDLPADGAVLDDASADNIDEAALSLEDISLEDLPADEAVLDDASADNIDEAALSLEDISLEDLPADDASLDISLDDVSFDDLFEDDASLDKTSLDKVSLGEEDAAGGAVIEEPEPEILEHPVEKPAGAVSPETVPEKPAEAAEEPLELPEEPVIPGVTGPEKRIAGAEESAAETAGTNGGEDLEQIIPEGFLLEDLDEGDFGSLDALEDDVSLDEIPEDVLPEEEAAPVQADLGPAGLPGGFRKELKQVLSYMDQLLESLPEEKIEEFAQSEYFDAYKKLFKELGLA
ncbi:MAG: hypothetical protein LBI94_03195, partial [Treponema sp.]|nr:hypothetical protein [Treponema sp.]